MQTNQRQRNTEREHFNFQHNRIRKQDYTVLAQITNLGGKKTYTVVCKQYPKYKGI